MLRSVCFKNFVRFKEYQVLDFPSKSSGPFIFIGENGSGKSSVFEGIRRCLKLEYSSSVSSVSDPTAPSYFISNFEVRSDLSECIGNIICGIVLIPSNEDDDEEMLEKTNQSTEESVMDTQPLEQITKGKETNVKTRYYKFVMKCSDNDPMFINLIDKTEGGTGLNVSKRYTIKSNFCTNERQNFIKAIIKQKPESLDVETYILQSVLKRIDNMSQDPDSKLLETILNSLTNDLVFVFPLRSVGPLQWSESKRLDSKYREKNYKEAERRCEIIKYFLTDRDEKFDKVKEKVYFEQLTQFVDYNFELKNDEITLPKGRLALLKTPEGILEAKAFSILISSKQYKTLILEEPDRGMHPQLVERMIQIINQEKKNKRVILTTHQKGFITPWTVTDTFIFRRCGKENRIISCMSMFGEENDANMKKRRLLTSHHVPDILFANKVLFCEGDSEELFLGELKRQILSTDTRNILKLLNKDDEEDANKLKNCMMEFTIIKMNGKDNREFYQTISDKLMLEHLVLVDKDAVPDILTTFASNMLKEDPKHIRSSLSKEMGIFFLLDGDIEKMVDKNEELKKALQDLKAASNEDRKFKELFLEEFERKLLSTDSRDILKLLNKDNEEEVNKLKNCLMEKLKLEHVFLVDKDAVPKLKKWASNMLKEYPKHIRSFLLKERGIFFWLDGDIEKMVTAMCDKNDLLKKVLQDLKVVSKVGRPQSYIKGKLFLGDKIKNSDITESVRLILDNSKQGDDLLELIHLLMKEQK